MTLLRAGARTLLASYFIAAGVKSVRNPDPLVSAAEPITDKLVPLVKQYAPDQVASFIPEDAKTLVRVNGAVQVVGGLALASGRGRRLGSLLLAGSLVLSTLAKYPFWSISGADEKALAKSHFLKNLSMLGGVLLAAGDTEGKPSLAWRAQKGGQQIAKSTGKATDKLAKKASNLTDSGSGVSDFADTALAGGAALVGTVVATTRKARKAAAKQAVEAQKAAAKAAKQAKKDAPKQLAAAKKFAAAQAATAQRVAAEQAEAARKAAKQAKKDAPKLAKQAKQQAAAARKDAEKRAAVAQKDAKKRAKKVGKHIELGSN